MHPIAFENDGCPPTEEEWWLVLEMGGCAMLLLAIVGSLIYI
jgi:hypothetical protein